MTAIEPTNEMPKRRSSSSWDLEENLEEARIVVISAGHSAGHDEISSSVTAVNRKPTVSTNHTIDCETIPSAGNDSDYNPSALFAEQEKELEKVLSMMNQSPVSGSPQTVPLEEEQLKQRKTFFENDIDSSCSLIKEQERLEKYCDVLRQELDTTAALLHSSQSNQDINHDDNINQCYVVEDETALPTESRNDFVEVEENQSNTGSLMNPICLTGMRGDKEEFSTTPSLVPFDEVPPQTTCATDETIVNMIAQEQDYGEELAVGEKQHSDIPVVANADVQIGKRTDDTNGVDEPINCPVVEGETSSCDAKISGTHGEKAKINIERDDDAVIASLLSDEMKKSPQATVAKRGPRLSLQLSSSRTRGGLSNVTSPAAPWSVPQLRGGQAGKTPPSVRARRFLQATSASSESASVGGTSRNNMRITPPAVQKRGLAEQAPDSSSAASTSALAGHASAPEEGELRFNQSGKTPPSRGALTAPMTRLEQPKSAMSESKSVGGSSRGNTRITPRAVPKRGLPEQTPESSSAASTSALSSLAGHAFSAEEGQARAQSRVHATKLKSTSKDESINASGTLPSKENASNRVAGSGQSKQEPRKVSSATLLSQQRRRQKLEQQVGSSSPNSIRNKKRETNAVSSQQGQDYQLSTVPKRTVAVANSMIPPPSSTSNNKPAKRIPLTERYLHMQPKAIKPSSHTPENDSSSILPRRKYGADFVPTRPKSPHFATSKRPRGALPSLLPRATMSSETSSVSKRTAALKQGSTTAAMGPKLVSESKYGCKLESNQHANKEPLPAANGKSTKARTTTVPVAPKFALDAKYGIKTSVPSSRDHHVEDDAATMVTRESKRSCASTTSSHQRRSTTVPIGPKFILDAKYGAKTKAPAIAVSYRQDSQVHHLGDSGNGSFMALPSHRSGLTVAVGPKFLLDAKYGIKQHATAKTQHSQTPEDSDARTVLSTQSAVSSHTQSKPARQHRTLTVPVGPNFLLDAKYGNKKNHIVMSNKDVQQSNHPGINVGKQFVHGM